MNAGLAKALGVMMKLDFERAVLNRVSQMEAHPDKHFRQAMFICDEYQHFATVGESEPTGDEKFFSLSRQPKCIPIIATQSISSLKSEASQRSCFFAVCCELAGVRISTDEAFDCNQLSLDSAQALVAPF